MTVINSIQKTGNGTQSCTFVPPILVRGSDGVVIDRSLNQIDGTLDDYSLANKDKLGIAVPEVNPSEFGSTSRAETMDMVSESVNMLNTKTSKK